MQSMAAVSQLRGLPSLGTQSSGLFGDVKTANFTFSSPKLEARSTIVRANLSGFNGANPPVPPRGNEPSMFQNAPIPPSPPTPELPNSPSATAPDAPRAPGLGLNFPGNQIPGLPGSPRPKPGTPRPYDPTKQKSKVMEWLTPPPPPKELLQREHFRLSPSCNCTIYFGDLSKWFVDGKSDAVIAPANKRLNTGPAVNAVLFKAAGSRLLDATQRLPDIAPQGIKAEVGDAISTRAFNLPVSRVIHTVGPVYKKNEQANEQASVRESDESLIKAYKSALGIARKENLVYLAFPPISCRIYGYPYSEGAEVALKTLKENSEGFAQIDIVIRNIEGYEAFIDQANKVLEVIKEKKVIKLPARNPGGEAVPPSPPAAAEAGAGAPPPPPAEAPASLTFSAEALPPNDIPPRPPTPAEATPVQSLSEEDAPPPPPPPVAPPPPPPAASFQSSTPPPPTPPASSAPGFPSPAGSSPAPPGPGFSQTPAAPPGPGFSQDPFRSPYSANYNPQGAGAPQFSNAQSNFQSGAPPPPPPPPPARPPFQNAPQFQPGPPQFQGFQPQYHQQQQHPGAPPPPPSPGGFQQYNQPPASPPPPGGFQQYNQPPSPPPPGGFQQYNQPPASPPPGGFQQYNQPPASPPGGFQQYNQPPASPPPPPPPHQQQPFQMSPYSAQYQGNSPPPPPPPFQQNAPPPSQFAPPFQQYQQDPPASPPPPPPSPLEAAAPAAEEAPPPLPPHQQKYVPPPPPPPPESKPIPPRERLSPFPPPNRPPRQPSSPTSTYEQPLF